MARKFVNMYSPHKRVFSTVGTDYDLTYNPSIDKETGVLELIQTGKTNRYLEIQCHKDSTDIHCILARFNAGDLDALNKRPVMFGDFTELPKSLAEAYTFVANGNAAFDTLPVEVRAKFNFSPSEFFARFDEFPQVMADYAAQPVPNGLGIVNATTKVADIVKEGAIDEQKPE